MHSDWSFDPALLKQAEQRWPFPLASTCRALRVSPHWLDALRPLTHLYEIVLKYLAALCLIEYRHCRQTDEALARFLMTEAYRGNQTSGRLTSVITRCLPHLHQHQEQAQIPGLAPLYTLADYQLEKALLAPLTQIRNRWSHAKDHVQYQPPRLEDFLRFRDLFSQLLQALAFFDELHWFYPHSVKQQQGQSWAEGVLLEGATQPFEPARLPLLHMPNTDELGLYIVATQKILSLSPFYIARPAQAGHYDIASLSQFRRRSCHFEPHWADPALAEQGYLDFMGAISLPEPDDYPAVPVVPSDISPAPEPEPPALVPTFRNATWRMFASDWDLQQLKLHNAPHYDALYQGSALWLIWRYEPGENAYLVGVRERLKPRLAPPGGPMAWLPECPAAYRDAFVPDKHGHWHHGHFAWAWWPTQAALATVLQHLDRGGPHASA